MSIKVTHENYSAYKKVFEIFCNHVFNFDEHNLPADTDPRTVLNRWEAKSKSLAKRGLQTSLNDFLSNLNDYSKEIIADINSELEKNKLPNIKELSGAIQKAMKQVVKTGKIKNIDQYYIVKEILDETVSKISADERSKLSDCLRNYELATRL